MPEAGACGALTHKLAADWNLWVQAEAHRRLLLLLLLRGLLEFHDSLRLLDSRGRMHCCTRRLLLQRCLDKLSLRDSRQTWLSLGSLRFRRLCCIRRFSIRRFSMQHTLPGARLRKVCRC